MQWEYIAEFRYLSHHSQQQASLFLYLDHDMVDELTSRLSERPASVCNFDPLEQIKRLPLHLDCVVASLQMSLSDVLALRPGDIVAARLQDPVEVRVNQQRLFRGSIFEDNGSLFLTSLESVKTP
ncbi:flagellar motor switch protein FliM [compost metagenome]